MSTVREILKVVFMFTGVISLVLTVEQFYLVNLVLKNKGKVNDSGYSRLLLAILFSLSVAVLAVIW